MYILPLEPLQKLNAQLANVQSRSYELNQFGNLVNQGL
jgi:hypothetical protein